MLKLILHLTKKWGGYCPKEQVIEDNKLGIFWEFIEEILPQSPDWLINELKNQTIMRINIIEFEHENGRVIIRDELDDPETGTYISIEENQLYEIIEKYAELAHGENYGVEED